MSSNEFVAAAGEIARDAGRILRERQSGIKIEYKGSADLVTAADRDAEAFIVGRLKQLFPTHGVVAEEGSRRELSSDYRWYVDPLDGTTNFAHQLPFFGVSIGLEHRGEIIAGVVYNPPLDELFAAEPGSATLNGKNITVSGITQLSESLLATGFPSQKRHLNPNIYFYHSMTLRSHGVRRFGSAALDLCYTACGRFEAFWEFKLKPWDVAAGAFILRQAGGTVTDMIGNRHELDSPEILATNGHVHHELLKLFNDIFEGRPGPELPSAAEYLSARKAEFHR